MRRGPPRARPTDTLLPYTTLFRYHGAGVAAAVRQRAEARAVAEMGDYRAAGRCGTVIIRESAGDELVGEAVEAVAAQSLLGEGQRQAVELVACRDRAVKGGGEAEIGSASCRERVGPYGRNSEAAELLKKKHKK